MKKILLFVAVNLAVWLGLVSCDNHTDEFDNSPKVGSILLSNGTVVSSEGFKASSLPAVGVIFYARRDTILVVGTKELGSYAYADSLVTISGVTNDYTSLCGTQNTAAIMASGIVSPAVNAVNKYATYFSSWALPSAGELRALSASLPVVSRTMKLIGGDDFQSGQYVSSSGDGTSSGSEQMYYYSVSLQSHYVTSTIKTTSGLVRPILRLH
jgi:hypothetical protein